MKTERPDIVTDEHLEYLDELRESGVTNMWLSHLYLQEDFLDLSEKEAKEVTTYWIYSFGKDDR